MGRAGAKVLLRVGGLFLQPWSFWPSKNSNLGVFVFWGWRMSFSLETTPSTSQDRIGFDGLRASHHKMEGRKRSKRGYGPRE